MWGGDKCRRNKKIMKGKNQGEETPERWRVWVTKDFTETVNWGSVCYYIIDSVKNVGRCLFFFCKFLSKTGIFQPYLHVHDTSSHPPSLGIHRYPHSTRNRKKLGTPQSPRISLFLWENISKLSNTNHLYRLSNCGVSELENMSMDCLGFIEATSGCPTSKILAIS